MKKIVIGANQDDAQTHALFQLIKILFPECEIQVTPQPQRGEPNCPNLAVRE